MADKKKAFNRDKIKEVIRNDIINAYHKRNKLPDFYSNTIDIFGAVIDCKLLRINLDEWKKVEQPRQTQKTVQNVFGRLHQTIIGTVDGWEDLGRQGTIVDVINRKRKIICEIKNKHNTTKGNHKYAIYDDLDSLLKRNEYKNYIGYYVEILPKNKKIYNEPFTPPDNRTSTRRKENKMIRKIDGKSFYEMVTGKEYAIRELYLLLPKIVDEILVEEKIISQKDGYSLVDNLIEEFYSKTFKY